MKTGVVYYSDEKWTGFDKQNVNKESIQAVIVFAGRALMETGLLFPRLHEEFPNASIMFGSTAGEINQNKAFDNSAVCVTISFEKTDLRFSCGNLKDYKDSREFGKQLAAKLPSRHLKYIWLISDGNVVNGEDLIKGISESIDESVIVSGGMAGDGSNFQKTLVGINEDVKEGNVVLMGLYGDHIRMGTGFKGGWDVFGPERIITRSSGNVLYEIDNENALDLYKRYLDKYADELPASALFFPISVKTADYDFFIVRTILSIDEKNKTMTFAGNVPEGASVKFMKSNFDHLINASSEAAMTAMSNLGKGASADLALLVSCVGRKLVLSSRVEEEIEAAMEHLTPGATVAGFFSYGEISPLLNNKFSHLHNQTITVTTFTEVD